MMDVSLNHDKYLKFLKNVVETFKPGLTTGTRWMENHNTIQGLEC